MSLPIFNLAEPFGNKTSVYFTESETRPGEPVPLKMQYKPTVSVYSTSTRPENLLSDHLLSIPNTFKVNAKSDYYGSDDGEGTAYRLFEDAFPGMVGDSIIEMRNRFKPTSKHPVEQNVTTEGLATSWYPFNTGLTWSPADAGFHAIHERIKRYKGPEKENVIPVDDADAPKAYEFDNEHSVHYNYFWQLSYGLPFWYAKRPDPSTPPSAPFNWKNAFDLGGPTATRKMKWVLITTPISDAYAESAELPWNGTFIYFYTTDIEGLNFPNRPVKFDLIGAADPDMFLPQARPLDAPTTAIGENEFFPPPNIPTKVMVAPYF